MCAGRRAIIVVALAAASANGCGGGASPANDGGASDASDAAVDVLLVCADATPPEAPATTPTGTPRCAGEVAVAGVTPFGPFVATNVAGDLRAGDCQGLSITFDDSIAGMPRGDEIRVTVGVPVLIPYQSIVGIHDGTAFVASGPTTVVAGARVEITSGEVYGPDGGLLPDGGRPGPVMGRIDVDTGCGHVAGTFSAPVCSFFTCQI